VFRLYAKNGGNPDPVTQLSTEHLHSLPVVFEVTESVRLPADQSS
jgi:hypothetical protein